MSHDTRMRGIILIGLAGLFVAVYLLLYHMGFYGAMLCGVGSCETVQASKYARFLGQPVPLWGTLWYAGVLVAGFPGARSSGRPTMARRPPRPGRRPAGFCSPRT